MIKLFTILFLNNLLLFGFINAMEFPLQMWQADKVLSLICDNIGAIANGFELLKFDQEGEMVLPLQTITKLNFYAQVIENCQAVCGKRLNNQDYQSDLNELTQKVGAVLSLGLVEAPKQTESDSQNEKNRKIAEKYNELRTIFESWYAPKEDPIVFLELAFNIATFLRTDSTLLKSNIIVDKSKMSIGQLLLQQSEENLGYYKNFLIKEFNQKAKNNTFLYHIIDSFLHSNPKIGADFTNWIKGLERWFEQTKKDLSEIIEKYPNKTYSIYIFDTRKGYYFKEFPLKDFGAGFDSFLLFVQGLGDLLSNAY